MMTVKIEGIEALERDLTNMARTHQSLFVRALTHIGRTVQRAAKLNAPKSPTKSQYVGELNRQRELRAAQGKKSRKAKSSSNRSDFAPGGLERSIRYEVRPFIGAVDIFVPVNSEAGQYAERMHETNYKLGPGSLAKKKQQSRAIGRDYITRAVTDEELNIMAALQSFVDDMAEAENRRR
jgi:hypothetical protein